jgi:hypothetical protein
MSKRSVSSKTISWKILKVVGSKAHPYGTVSGLRDPIKAVERGIEKFEIPPADHSRLMAIPET